MVRFAPVAIRARLRIETPALLYNADGLTAFTDTTDAGGAERLFFVKSCDNGIRLSWIDGHENAARGLRITADEPGLLGEFVGNGYFKNRFHITKVTTCTTGPAFLCDEVVKVREKRKGRESDLCTQIAFFQHAVKMPAQTKACDIGGGMYEALMPLHRSRRSVVQLCHRLEGDVFKVLADQGTFDSRCQHADAERLCENQNVA